MTAGEDAWFELDSEGCLLVIGSYSYRAGFVREVVQQASKRILASPSLSDFVDVKFVDLGMPPDLASAPADAVGRLVRELARHGGFAARNYFALVILDRSATAVRQMLLACLGDEFIASLPVNYLGIASVDDRGRAERKADGESALTFAIAPDGAWDRSDLVTELQRHAEHLMRDFATPTREGITTGRFDELRPEDYLEEPPAESLAEPPAGSPILEPEPESWSAPLPDVLDHVAGARTHSASGELVGWQASLKEDAERASRTAQARMEEPDAGSDWPAIFRLPFRPGAFARTGRSNPVAHRQPTSGPVGVVYLILSSNEVTDEQADWRRGRSVLLALDGKLAATPQIAYQVRAAQVTADVTRDNLRPAGQLSRRDLKRHAEPTELSHVLAGIDRAMTRDLAAFQQSGAEITRPAVVIFAADAPLADLATIEVLEKLASKADISWVAPEKVLTILSPRFARLCGTDPIPYHEAVAEEIMAALLPCPSLDQGPRPEPSESEPSESEGSGPEP